MKYNVEQSTGHAGEHFFAYWVIHEFNWPCRLLNLDIGIDGQIELMDENSNTTGEFLEVQIKSTRTAGENSIVIYRKHLDYWNANDTTVLICRCNLATKEIHFLTSREVNIEDGCDSVTVDMVAKGYLLSTLAINKLRGLANGYLGEVFEEECQKVLRFVELFEQIPEGSPHYEDLADDYPRIVAIARDLNVRKDGLSSRLGDQWDSISDRLDTLKTELTRVAKIDGNRSTPLWKGVLQANES